MDHAHPRIIPDKFTALHIDQWVTCLATNAYLNADKGVDRQFDSGPARVILLFSAIS